MLWLLYGTTTATKKKTGSYHLPIGKPDNISHSHTHSQLATPLTFRAYRYRGRVEKLTHYATLSVTTGLVIMEDARARTVRTLATISHGA